VRKSIEDRAASDAIHSDITYEEQPAGLSILKIDLIPLGGDTIWWSGYEAYDRLSPAFQKFVDGLSAVHTGEHHQKLAKASGRPIRREFPPDTTHPVVR
jgi:sulfonate dioxygenase